MEWSPLPFFFHFRFRGGTPNPTPSSPFAGDPSLWTLAAITALGLAAAGCSDDDDDDDNANEALQADFQELADFANSLDDGPAPQIIAHPELANLFAEIGINLRPGAASRLSVERSGALERADPRIAHAGPTLSRSPISS